MTWGTHARVFSHTRAWEQQERNKTKKTTEDGKKRGVSMERSNAFTKKRSPDSLSHPNRNTIIIIKHNMAIFYKKWKKDNEIQLTKKNKWI